MQTDAQKLVVVRDQFALKGLSDDALKQILPAYREALERLQFLLRTMPEGNIQRELWLRTQLATIEAQFRPVADRIYQVLPEAQARAFEEGLTNARKYLEAGGIQPEPAAATTTLSSTTISGQQVSVTGNLPGLNITSAVDKGFISPSITRQQIVAAARETGFSVLSPGGSTKGLADLLPNYTAALGKQVQDKLRAGFLLGLTNEEMERQVISVAGELGPGRRGRAMTEALVRTSMAEASQSAHDAFYEANEDLLPKTKSGYRWWWDASNDTRLCPVCAPLDGVKFKERGEPPHSWPAHFSCRCKLLPITATMELMEEEDGPASGSFLEATPVEYDRRGKRLPPPAGYTGDNAYKRPMKIDGQQQWVRRRDLGPGQTTAGDMLQNANEHSKRMVLGKHTEAFNKLTGKGGQYEKDPQGAVRKLLGNPLPPGSTPPRPTRGPAPKPPAPPKPKTPVYTEEEKARIREETSARLRARAAAREAAAAPPTPPPAPKPATPPSTPKPAATPAPKPTPNAAALEFSKSRNLMDTGAKLSPTQITETFERLGQGDSLAAQHMNELLQFQQKQNLSVVWSTGREKSYGRGPNLDYLKKSPEFISSLESAAKRGGKAAGMTADIISDLKKGQSTTFLTRLGVVGKGAAGHTADGFGAVVIKRASHQSVLKSAADVANYREQIRLGVRDASFRTPAFVTDRYAFVKNSKGDWINKQDWLTTYTHEMGHQVHYAAGQPALPEGANWTPSKYGATNMDERFAETFVQYVHAPEDLKKANPTAYKWISDALKKALK
jgi:hypothetical protein